MHTIFIAVVMLFGPFLLFPFAKGFTTNGPSIIPKPTTSVSFRRCLFQRSNPSEEKTRRQNLPASNILRFPSSSSSSSSSIPSSIPSSTTTTSLGAVPEGMQWFVKTEQFNKPYPIVKPYLEAHREWIRSIRQNHTADAPNETQPTVVSGYRVDSQNKPGGGGLMIFSAQNYEAAEEFVRQDPLIVNGCVDWELQRWIPETGDITLE